MRPDTMVVEKYRDVMKLPHDIEAELDGAPLFENLEAAMGTLELEHKRRRNLLEHAGKAERLNYPDKATAIKAAIMNGRSAAKETAAWEDFTQSNPSAEQAAIVLAHVSHFRSAKPTLLDMAIDFFLLRIQEVTDAKKSREIVALAANAIRSRHLDDPEKKGYLRRLQLLNGVGEEK
ncbi:MAG: hypothetical protein G01um10148_555 [Parcubacteria group bacterium Gr01-1014_8]|nr:MAG: hypothetical protein G01um10148_555 [Parcubacteria group bacterium Gr01-1014_8]